jgi:glycine betaine/proline transport system permease protein
MFDFPDFLKFGDEIANLIDSAFDVIKSVFGWLFDIIRVVILTSLDFVNYLLTGTPWWIWVAATIVYLVLDRFASAKVKWLSVLGLIVVWLIFNHTFIVNPAIRLDLGNTQTPWWVFVALLFIVSRSLYNWKTATVFSLLLVLIGVFGVWDAMISTLAIIIISVLISFMIGIPFGIWMAKSKGMERTLKPILDMMQTIPSFVYLIPAVMLFRIGRMPATFATIVYAVPPLIRLTFLGIRNVDAEMIEAGKSFGSTPRQLLLKVEIPQALSTIATGLNQTTMMAVAMVVIASMIGAGGLGSIVLIANRNIDIGGGFVGGFAIVFLAIILDRLLQGVANKLEEKRGGV